MAITRASLKIERELLNTAPFFMSMVILTFDFFCFDHPVSPKITPFTFGQPKNFGAMVSVQCILGEGDLPVKILWEFNGKPLDSGDGIMINAFGSRVSNLMIESVEGRHAGNYTCTSKNRAGSKSFTSQLEVIGTKLIFKNLFHLFSQPSSPTSHFPFYFWR